MRIKVDDRTTFECVAQDNFLIRNGYKYDTTFYDFIKGKELLDYEHFLNLFKEYNDRRMYKVTGHLISHVQSS